MSVIDYARLAAADYPTGEGYIVAFICVGWGGSKDAPVEFLKKNDGVISRKMIARGLTPRPVTGTTLAAAHIYSTYQGAADAAASWKESDKPSTRIIRVRQSRPFELLEDHPITLLDALAEL